MNYKRIVDKLIWTIEKNGIPEKVRKWKKPKLKYEFDSYDEMYKYLFKLAESYDKHTILINGDKEEEYYKNNKSKIPKNKKPVIKIIDKNILYLKFYGYTNLSFVDWKKDLEEWVIIVKRKIDKKLDKKLNGLIVDLTEHTGGNMWSAIRSMSRIYGETSLLRFTSEKNWINMKEDKEKGGKFISDKLKFKEKIYVIVSDNTASSGELIAATFKGRKNTYLLEIKQTSQVVL